MSDRQPDASGHLQSAKAAAASAASNAGTAVSEVAQAAQAYVQETGHRGQTKDDKPTIQEHYQDVRQRSSGRIEENQQAAEDVLRSWRQTADDHAQRTKELASTRIEEGQRSAEEALRGISSTVQDQVHAAQEAASSVATSATDQVRDAAGSAISSIDRGIQVSTNAVKSATAQALTVADQLTVQSRVYYEVGKAQYKVVEDHLFSSLKGGVETALANPNTTSAVLAGLAFVVLPGPRRFLWRQSFGRLRSDESIYLSAQKESEKLGESVQGFTVESGKLGQRLASAESQYVDGMRKVKATSRQLQSLSKEIAKSEKGAQSLLWSLQRLSSAEAVALRAEVAAKLNAAKVERKSLQKLIHGVTKQGL